MCIGSVQDVVLDRQIAGRPFASARDEFRAVVERDHVRSELRHSPGESSCAACDVEDRVAGVDVEEAFGGRLDQQRLEGVAVTDAVVPPAGVGVPDAAIVVGMFGKLTV